MPMVMLAEVMMVMLLKTKVVLDAGGQEKWIDPTG